MDGLAQQSARKTVPGLVQLSDGQWFYQGGAIPEKEAHSMLNPVVQEAQSKVQPQQGVDLGEAYKSYFEHKKVGQNIVGAASRRVLDLLGFK